MLRGFHFKIQKIWDKKSTLLSSPRRKRRTAISREERIANARNVVAALSRVTPPPSSQSLLFLFLLLLLLLDRWLPPPEQGAALPSPTAGLLALTTHQHLHPITVYSIVPALHQPTLSTAPPEETPSAPDPWLLTVPRLILSTPALEDTMSVEVLQVLLPRKSGWMRLWMLHHRQIASPWRFVLGRWGEGRSNGVWRRSVMFLLNGRWRFRHVR